MSKCGLVFLVIVALACGTVLAQGAAPSKEKPAPAAQPAVPPKAPAPAPAKTTEVQVEKKVTVDKKGATVEHMVTKKVETGEIRQLAPIFGIQVLPGIVETPEEVRYESANKHAVKILKVFPGTMAERAGLQPGDLLYRLNGRKIKSFDRLIDIIGDMRPEVMGKVEYLRNRATHVQEFQVENTFVDENQFVLWRTLTNKFVGRCYVLGLFSVYKEMANDACKEYSFAGPFIWDWKRFGTSEDLRILLFFDFEKGDRTPIVF